MKLVYDQLDIVADELLFEGELVAILTTNACATTRGRFEDLIRDGIEQEDEDKATDPDVDDYDRALDDLERAAKEFAKGGLLRMSDLATIIKRLKDEDTE